MNRHRGTFLAVVVALAAGVVVAPAAQAVTLITPDGQTAKPWQRWVDTAKVPTSDATLTIRDGRCWRGGERDVCLRGDTLIVGMPRTLHQASERRARLLAALGRFHARSVGERERETFLALSGHRTWREGGRSGWAAAWMLCGLGGKNARQYRYYWNVVYLEDLPDTPNPRKAICASIRGG